MQARLVYFDGLKLSVSDVILIQKNSNGDRKLQFFGRDYNFTRSLCAKHIFGKIILINLFTLELATRRLLVKCYDNKMVKLPG